MDYGYINSKSMNLERKRRTHETSFGKRENKRREEPRGQAANR